MRIIRCGGSGQVHEGDAPAAPAAKGSAELGAAPARPTRAYRRAARSSAVIEGGVVPVDDASEVDGPVALGRTPTLHEVTLDGGDGERGADD
jgi:hypothetical protein